MDSFNRRMPTVAVAAITSKVKRGALTVFLPAGEPLEQDSEILPFQILTIDQSRLETWIGELSPEQVTALEEKLRLCWGL